MLEGGPWMERNSPIFLSKWSTNVNLSKEDHAIVPVWIKLHDIPILGFTNDGLSVIASKVGKPLMLDSYNSSMCVNGWGRPSFARAMIEISAENPLKEKVIVATPYLDDAGRYTKDIVHVEYEWKPPRCNHCKVFGDVDLNCPLNIHVKAPEVKKKDTEGFEEVTRRKGKNKLNGFPLGKTTQFEYRPKEN